MEMPQAHHFIAIFVGMISVSFASIFVRLSTSPPLVIATYRLGIASMILCPLTLYVGGLRGIMKLRIEEILRLIVVGVVLAVHFGSWITSLNYTSVASSVIIVNVSPIFVAVMSYFILQEKISLKAGLGVALAFLGASIIAIGDADFGQGSIQGDAYAFLGALMLAIYILSGRRIRQRLSLLSYVFPVYSTCAATLTISCLAMKIPLYPYPTNEYLIFTALAVIPTIFGHTLYNWALKYFEAPIIAVSFLGEPIGSTLLAMLILNEFPRPLTIIGGIFIFTGIYLTTRVEQH